ncbi:MAG: O-antigen ligase family protein [Ruminococcus sp.]|nr:O-antigen ligase family protein [Ruminococcus sp.]
MAKTIFNSSEKSNFILNMTEEKYSSIASKALAVMCFAVSVFAIPAECIKSVGFPIVSGGLAIAGVICLILALIAVMKKFVSKSMLIPVCAFGAMLLWGVISLVNSYDTMISFYGFDGRGEGLLAIIFYFGFFLTGLTIKNKKAISTLLNSIVAVGVLNAVWGLLQVFVPAMPSSYSYVIVAGQINSASGLAQSPVFLAMMLTMALTASVTGFVSAKSKTAKSIYLCCSCLFSFTMICTYTLVGVVGLAVASLSAVACVFITKARKANIAGIAGIILPAVLAVVLVNVGVIGDSGSFKLHDGPLFWTDSYQRLSSSGIYNSEALDITSTSDVYYYLNERTMDIIKDYPLAGTGPENLVYPQLYKSMVIYENTGTFDKVYNEYLYTAGTRGIPSLIALLAVIVSLIIISAKKLKENSKTPQLVSAFLLLVAGTIIFFISCSNIAFSPIFWAVAGASCASLSEKSSAENKKKR